MQRAARGRHEAFSSGRHWFSAGTALVFALALVGCTTTGRPTVGFGDPQGPTIAFESIDGPPESVFDKLVQRLSEEAEARQLPVVSRNAPAQYRVRGYLATFVTGKRATVAWVWDVYDAGQRRALRIAGEETADGAGHGTWAVADDELLRRIARSGMERLAGFLTAVSHIKRDPPYPAQDAEEFLAIASAGQDKEAEAVAASAPSPQAPVGAGHVNAPVPPEISALGLAAPATLAYSGVVP